MDVFRRGRAAHIPGLNGFSPGFLGGGSQFEAFVAESGRAGLQRPTASLLELKPAPI
jgi:hypothetical protein